MTDSSELGGIIKTFQFEGVSRQTKVQVPLMISVALATLILLIVTPMSNIGADGEQDQTIIWIKTALVVAPVVFAVVVLPLLRISPLKIVVYEDGLCIRHQCWRWTELDALLVMNDGRTTTIWLYADQVVARVNQPSPQMTELVDMLKQKTDEKWLPSLIDDYRSGKAVSFGNLAISSTHVEQNGLTIPLTSIHDYSIKDQTIIFRGGSGLPALVTILVGLPNGYLFPAFLRSILPNAEVTL